MSSLAIGENIVFIGELSVFPKQKHFEAFGISRFFFFFTFQVQLFQRTQNCHTKVTCDFYISRRRFRARLVYQLMIKVPGSESAQWHIF